MIDPVRVLAPLDEVEDAIHKLTVYGDRTELARALESVWEALQRSLRLLLRADPEAPGELRLSAFSPEELPLERVLEVLRSRGLISIELAGLLHQTEQAARRAGTGDVRAEDGDAADRAVDRLRAEVRARADRPVQDAAHNVVEGHDLDAEEVHAVPARLRGRGRSRTLLVAGVVVALLAAAALIAYFATRGSTLDDAVAAFRQGRLGVAEAGFRQAVHDDPGNVVALLFLARIYRREGRYADARDALRLAVQHAPQDPDVRRELGYLFMALKRPDFASEQFQQAVQMQPDEKLNWIGLVRALRAAGDPRADEMLHRAPPEAQAILGSG